MNLNLIKEKIETYGEDTVNDIELLSILLGKNIADIFTKNNIFDLKSFIGTSDKDMMNIKGVGKNTLLKINAIKELYKRKLKYNNNVRMSMPKDIYENNSDMALLSQEVLRLLCLNTKNEIIYKEDIFKGSLNTSIVHPREIFKEAINKSSASIVVVHNHPSGDPTPSKEDVNITMRIRESGQIIGIKLLDHIIIGNDRFISLKEKGLM